MYIRIKNVHAHRHTTTYIHTHTHTSIKNQELFFGLFDFKHFFALICKEGSSRFFFYQFGLSKRRYWRYTSISGIWQHLHDNKQKSANIFSLLASLFVCLFLCLFSFFVSLFFLVLSPVFYRCFLMLYYFLSCLSFSF